MVGRALGGAVNVGTAIGNIVVNSAGVATGISQASGHLRGFSLESIAMIRGFRAVSDAALGIGTAIAGGLGIAVKEFAKFEQSLRNVSSLGLDAGQTFDDLKQAVLTMATETAIGPSELADALYEIRSAGFSASDSLLILRASADAANAGLTNAKTAADLISSVILAYGFVAADAAKVSNVLFATVVTGKVTFEDLARTMGFVLPTAKAMGVSLEELGASFASLTNQGLSVRAAGNSINSMLNSLIKPTKALSAAFAQNGIESGQMLIAQRGLGGAIQFLDEISGHNVSTLQKLLGNQRSTRAELFLAANGAREYAKALKANEEAQDGAGATAKVLAEQQKALAFQIKQMKTELTVAAIQFGEVLAPAIIKATNVIQSFARFLNELSPGTRTIITDIAAFIAILFVTVGALGRVVTMIIRFSESIRLLRLGIAQTNAQLVQTGAAANTASSGLNTASGSARTAAASFGAFLKSAAQLAAIAAIFIEIKDIFHILSGESSKAGASIAAMGKALKGVAFVEDFLGFDEAAKNLREKVEKTEDTFEAKDIAVKLGLKVDDNQFLRSTKIVIGNMSILASDVKAMADQSGQSIQDVLIHMAEMRGVTTDQIDAIKAQTGAQEDSNKALEETATVGDTAAQTYENLTDQVDNLGKKLSEAEEAFSSAVASGLLLPLTPSPEGFQQFNEDVDKAINGVLESVGSLASAADPLAFMRAQFALTGRSVASMALQMEQLGIVDVFPEGTEDTLKLVANLEKTEQRIEKVSAAIQNNSEDMAMWQGRIDLVSGLFGSNQEKLDEWIKKYDEGKITFSEFTRAIGAGEIVNFDKLNALLDEGKISRAEYDAAVREGTWLIERSAGALHDEAAEQVRLIPILAEWVRKHDEAHGAVQELSDDQRLLAGLLKDSAVQQALATVQMVTYLAAIGQIPESKATEVITNLAGSDDRINAVLNLLGLIPDKKSIEIDAQMDEAQRKLHEIQVERDALLTRRAVLLVQPQTEETRKEIGNINDQLGFLTDEEHTVQVAMDSQDFDNAIFDANRELDGITGPHEVGIDASGVPKEIQLIDEALDAAIEQERSMPTFFTPEQADELTAKLDEEINTLQQKLDDVKAGKIEMDDSEVVETQNRIRDLGEQKIQIAASVDEDGTMAANLATLRLQIQDLKQQKLDVKARIDAEDAMEGIQSLDEARRRLVEQREQIALLPPSPETRQQLALVDELLQRIDASQARAEVGLDPGDTMGLLDQIAKELGTIADPKDLTIRANFSPVQAALDDVLRQRATVVDELNAISAKAFGGDQEAQQRTDELLQQLAALDGQVDTLTLIVDTQNAQDQLDDVEGRLTKLRDRRVRIQTGLEPPPSGRTIAEELVVIDKLIKANEDRKIFIQTVLETAQAQGLLDQAGKPTETVTVPVEAKGTKETFQELQDVNGAMKEITDQGELVINADSSQAVAEFEKVNNLSLITRPDIKIQIDGREVTALQVRVDNLFDVINKHVTAKYQVFLEGDAKSAVDAADLAGQHADSVAKVYTAFFNADTTTFQDQVEFVSSLLETLGITTANAVGEIGINFTVDPGSALAIIQSVNNDIDEKLLRPEFLVHLDANNDQFLSATELAAASAEALTTDPWVATFLAEVDGAMADLQKVDGVKKALVRDGNEIHIEVDSAEAAQKFIDLNREDLAGKTVVIKTRDEATGKLTTLDEINIPDKEIVFNARVDQGSKEEAEKDLQDVADKGSQTVETKVEAKVTAEGKAELDDLNGKVTVFQSLDGKSISIGVDTKEEGLDFITKNAEALEGKQVDITIVGEDSTAKFTIQELKDSITKETQTMPVDVDMTAANEEINATKLGVADLQTELVNAFNNVPLPAAPLGTVPPVTMPPIVTPPADTSQTVDSLNNLTPLAQGAADSAQASFAGALSDIGADGAAAAQAFGNAFVLGLAEEMNRAFNNTVSSRNNILFVLNSGATAALESGKSVGAFFAVGVAIGIAENAQAAYSNAAALGQGIHDATAGAIESGSPSKRGILLGIFFSQGVAIGIENAARLAIEQARNLGSRVTAEFKGSVTPFSTSSLVGPGMDSLGGGLGGRSQFGPVAAVVGAKQQTANINNIHAPISISGVSDPELASDLAIKKLHRVFSRIDRGGG